MAALTRDEVLGFYNSLPFEHHPLWRAILSGTLSYQQVLMAEQQHFIRSNIGRSFREKAARDSADLSPKAHALLMETYYEECTDDETGPSHVALIERLLVEGGKSEAEIRNAIPTAGNSAAIALYKDIGDRGPLHHMIAAGAVEYFYSGLSPKIFSAYQQHYGMSEHQAETYKIHGPMDRQHAERALSILDDAQVVSMAESIRYAVRDAFVATSLHYDGMLQAALGKITYWSGL